MKFLATLNKNFFLIFYYNILRSQEQVQNFDFKLFELYNIKHMSE